MPTRHALTILAVSDLATSLAFYQGVFGWQLQVDVPVYKEFALPAGMRLGLYERVAFAANTGRVPIEAPTPELALAELYLYADDFDATLDLLRAHGATELSGPADRPWGDHVAYYRDPDGVVLAIAR